MYLAFDGRLAITADLGLRYVVKLLDSNEH
jgi:hypothetical protein